MVTDGSLSLKSTMMCTIVVLTKYYYGEQTKKNVMGGASSTYGGEERCTQGFGAETRGKETTWKAQV